MNQFGIADEFLVFKDEGMFFNIVQTTPDWIEALDMLKRARVAVLREKEVAAKRRDGDRDQQLAMLLTKLKDEIRLYRDKVEATCWQQAVRSVYGDEGVRECLAWIAQERGENFFRRLSESH